jgi:hypothetical protein
MSYGKTMEAIIKDKELKAYEKGVRDMYYEFRKDCASNISEYKKEDSCFHRKDTTGKCTFETCPIAEKLLKGVK